MCGSATDIEKAFCLSNLTNTSCPINKIDIHQYSPEIVTFAAKVNNYNLPFGSSSKMSLIQNDTENSPVVNMMIGFC